MRLLKLNDDGQLALTKDLPEPVPPYAILSHTWGDDDDEVTFEELGNASAEQKPGYAKLRFCVEQAKADRLDYAWCDTACIRRASLSELSEAITSMFRWYQAAAKCYVYLADVETPPSRKDATWDQTFRASRWHQRGWTLQELIANGNVEFFSRDFQYIGNKSNFEQELSEVTGIPQVALRVGGLSQYSPRERLQWAARRVTTKPEDKAYCLLGLLGVSMDLRYGEREQAFRRLMKKVDKVEAAAGKLPAVSDVDFQKARTTILSSLFFPEMDSRRQQIAPAHRKTFQWLLDPSSRGSHRAFLTWLQDDSLENGLFWISGKPGSGKSSLMTFLAQSLRTGTLADQIVGATLASFYFWSPGHTMLQKSLIGMLRGVLHDLFEQNPTLIDSIVNPRRWNAVVNGARSVPPWTLPELGLATRQCLQHLGSSTGVLLLIDGLDECDAPGENPDELLAILQDFAALPKVKVCTSSRPLTNFSEALGGCPSLKLHEVTQSDIFIFVVDSLTKEPSFLSLQNFDPDETESIVDSIITRADGVFLWIRLVIKELIATLRDGADLKTLKNVIDTIPPDLDQYFDRIFESVDVDHRKEASAMLQIALWNERDFIVLRGLELIDFLFLDEFLNGYPEVLTKANSLDLRHPQALHYRLGATFRKLRSRCKGLLECHDMTDSAYYWNDMLPKESKNMDFQDFESMLSTTSTPDLLDRSLKVELLHRSLRDFLSTKEKQLYLRQLTGGPVDARRFRCFSRLLQAESAVTAELSIDSLDLHASHIICALATRALRTSADSLLLYSRLTPVIQSLLKDIEKVTQGFYITPSLTSWHREQSTLLSLALDFNLTRYIETHLTPFDISGKKGRPLLDYVVQPRFEGEGLRIGFDAPNPALTAKLLSMGADPDEMYEMGSILSRYMSSMHDFLYGGSTLAQGSDHGSNLRSYFDTLRLLLQASRATHFPINMLSEPYSAETYSRAWHGGQTFSPTVARHGGLMVFKLVKRGLLGEAAVPPGSEVIAIAQLLESFRKYYGNKIDELQNLVSLKTNFIKQEDITPNP
jgi:hypothetical protein